MDGASLLTTTIALVVVCALAVGVLRAIGGRGGARGKQGMRVLGRLAVEPRRSVVVIEVAGRCFLVGVGDGPMALLAELDAADARAQLAAKNSARSSAGGVEKFPAGGAEKVLTGGAENFSGSDSEKDSAPASFGGVFRAALARVLGGAPARSGRDAPARTGRDL